MYLKLGNVNYLFNLCRLKLYSMQKFTQEEGLLRAYDLELINPTEDNYYKLFKKIARIKKLNWSEKALLVLILSYTKHNQIFMMSNVTIGEELGMSTRNVNRTLNLLKTNKLVKTVKRVNTSTGKIVGRIIHHDQDTINEYITRQEDNYVYIEY